MDITRAVKLHNPRDVPMADTGFYKWLDKGNWHDYAYDGIAAYLKENFLYERGVDHIKRHVVEDLWHISGHFTHIVMRPIWRHK